MVGQAWKGVGRLTSIGGPLSESSTQLTESSTVAVVGEERFICRRSGNNSRRRKGSRSRGRRIQAPEALLQRLQCSWDGGGPEVYHVGAVNLLRHKA